MYIVSSRIVGCALVVAVKVWFVPSLALALPFPRWVVHRTNCTEEIIVVPPLPPSPPLSSLFKKVGGASSKLLEGDSCRFVVSLVDFPCFLNVYLVQRHRVVMVIVKVTVLV